jgi:hypothetical protein
MTAAGTASATPTTVDDHGGPGRRHAYNRRACRQKTITLRIGLPSCMSSKPRLISSSFSVCVIIGSISRFEADKGAKGARLCDARYALPIRRIFLSEIRNSW